MGPSVSRRDFIQAASAGVAAVALSHHDDAVAAESAVSPVNRAPLAAQPYYLLPTGAIKPAGWLRRQLEIQAAGLGGRLDETWQDVGPDSGWLGGSGEAWERGPYFLDGLVPLAWQLDSPALKAKAQRFLDWTLDHPGPDGMIGPCRTDADHLGNDWWPRMVILKVLTQYYDLTTDPRVIPVMRNYFKHQLEALPGRPLIEWSRFRWQDEALSIVWLYNRTGDRWLLDLLALLKKQGFDWQALFADFPFKEKSRPEKIWASDTPEGRDHAFWSHGVNHAMALKMSPLWSLFSTSAEDRAAIGHQLATLDQYHGIPNGMFSADEHLAGRNPSQGVELCAVVEAMFSLEVALAITGKVELADRIERIAYNALPGTFSDDMWTHQYDQQPNQVECSLHKSPWSTNGPESNLFGLEPNYGCCTANFHQGWPKFAASAWMASADGGLAAALYAPCTVETQVRGIAVRLEEVTDYPFRDRVTIKVAPSRPMKFPLHLRVPSWCKGISIAVNDVPIAPTGAGTFTLVDRLWRLGDVVELRFDNPIHATCGFNDSVAFEQGALIFSLPIAEAWVKWRDRGLTADWQVYPASSWNYGVLANAVPRRIEGAMGEVPFSRRTPAVSLSIDGRRVPGWKAEEGAADPVPVSPVAAKDAGERETLTLIPYGAAKLRITSFPVVEA